MNKVKATLLNYISVLCCVTVLTACSNVRSPAIFTPIQTQDNKIIVYVYRAETMANAMYSPDLYINDEYRLPVKNGAHYHFTLPPDDYRFTLKRNDKILASSISENLLHSDTVYYYRVDTTLKLNDSSQYQPYLREFILLPVDALSAQKEIAECCLNRQQSAAFEKNNQDNDGANSGFSVDKTQNPFSH